MKKLPHFILLLFLIIFVSCGSEMPNDKQVQIVDDGTYFKNQMLMAVHNAEDKMHKSTQLDPKIAGEALQAYSEYIGFYPDDSLAPDFLFKSAEIETAIQRFPQAYSHYKSIAEKYPKYKLVVESLFLEASILDNYLNEDDKAKLVYEDLIKKYPDSPYANDAKAAIKNLGKSDAELIKEFQKKNGEKN